jgi:hypothetical protein
VSPTSSDAAFVDEVLRVNARYLDELVEGYDVCPFARGARLRSQVARRVLLDETPDPTAALEAIDELAREETIAVALLIFPRLPLAPDPFDRFVGELRAASKPPFAMAMFHPDAAYDLASPQQMVMFFRRAPDPTIQLVRFSVLDAVKGPTRADGKFLFDWSARGWAELARRSAEVSVSEQIAQANHATALREGITRLQAVLDDIRADRARTYARFPARGRSLSGT